MHEKTIKKYTEADEKPVTPDTPREFLIALKEAKRAYPELYPVLAAWWSHECAYGTSALAKSASNFAGLKYRHDLSAHVSKDIWDSLSKTEHIDWSGQPDPYFSLSNPSLFIHVFMGFLRRSLYSKYLVVPSQTWQKSFENNGILSPRFLEYNPLTFLSWVAECGFCASTPTVKKEDHQNPQEYKAAVQSAYVYSILKVYHSPKFQVLLKEVEEDGEV